jgi:hypothetical protein
MTFLILFFLVDYPEIELSRCATACQGCGAAFLLLKKQ